MKHRTLFGIAFYLSFLIVVVNSCANSVRIIEKPIIFDESRKQLTLEYLYDRYGLVQESPNIDPKMIVLHWTVFSSLDESFKAFENPILPDYRPEIAQKSGLNVSSHFMIDRDGSIYRLMPETTMARHIIGLNHCSIGVENIGGTGEFPLTKAQLEANIWLVKYLKAKFNIEYLIGHYEYTNFEEHPYWLEKDTAYRTQKSDPGKDFMRKVRKATKNLNFKPVPINPIVNEND